MRYFSVFLLLISSLSGAEYEPWFGRAFQLEAPVSILYQHYNDVDTDTGRFPRKSNDLFFKGGLQVAIMDNWEARAQMELAHTRHQDFNFDHGSITGRYLWLNDIIGDPVSLTTGVTFSQASTLAVHDLSSFHHSNFEVKFHTSVGKEVSCYDSWLIRYWWANLIGLGDTGSPWYETHVAYQYHFRSANWIELFTKVLIGFGGKNLDLFANKFRGYGPISHRSIDVGLALFHQFDYSGLAFIKYSYRPYAKNFPENTSRLEVEYVYPFNF